MSWEAVATSSRSALSSIAGASSTAKTAWEIGSVRRTTTGCAARRAGCSACRPRCYRTAPIDRRTDLPRRNGRRGAHSHRSPSGRLNPAIDCRACVAAEGTRAGSALDSCRVTTNVATRPRADRSTPTDAPSGSQQGGRWRTPGAHLDGKWRERWGRGGAPEWLILQAFPAFSCLS